MAVLSRPILAGLKNFDLDKEIVLRYTENNIEKLMMRMSSCPTVCFRELRGGGTVAQTGQ